MKKINVIEGQVNIFDLPIQEPINPREEIIAIEKLEIKEDKFKGIMNLYKENCIRIVKQVCGALLVEVEDRTLYFNSLGINELELKKDMELLPGDEILIVNQDREINDIQLKKIKDMHVTEYIKRKGDANIIIQMSEQTIVINPKGWVIEYEQKPSFKEDEVVILENSIKISEDEELKIGDPVEFEYDGKQSIGKIKSIYNNGETVNVSWDNKSTAFYYKCVKKIA